VTIYAIEKKMFRIFQRNYSSTVSSLYKVAKHKDYFDINNQLQISFAWLRDNCRSSLIYDARNNQKKIEFPEITEVSNFSCQESELSVLWKDGHTSTYNLLDLENNFKQKDASSNIKEIPWTSSSFPTNATVNFDDYMNTNEGLKSALEKICINGFCFVSGTPVSTKLGTKVVAERIGPIFQTTYGDLWELTTKQAGTTSDASYGSGKLEPHTDATYLRPATGLQLFHCLQPAADGGDTMLVDGFQLALDFKERSPEGYEFFSTCPLESRYLHTASEPHVHYRNRDLVFKMYPNSEDLMQIRLNAYRAFHPIMDLSTQQKYYNFFPNLIEMSQEEKYCKTFSMTPDVVLIVNNWRLLHGRTDFKGQRTLSGCYLGHMDFMSRCRSLGIPVREPFL